MFNNLKVLLVGSGNMAIEYAKVLNALEVDFTVVGRSIDSCKNFEQKTGVKAISGGIQEFFKNNMANFSHAILTVGVEALTASIIDLIKKEIPFILTEKPGFTQPSDLSEILRLLESSNSNVFIAYNRRFYKSIIELERLIEQDGGLKSFIFEFTEWSHIVKNVVKNKITGENWFYANSTHVLDSAFYLAGLPTELNSLVSGRDTIPFHPKSSIFTGSGNTESGALFSYHANWNAPGRWYGEFLTSNFRYILRPIEKLFVQKIGSVQVEEVENIDYSLDEKYKPGLFLQTKAFLENYHDKFLTLESQSELVEKVYSKIAGY